MTGDVTFLRDLPRFAFFTGKGGVGKTSLACAAAVHLADAGKRVLLVSTDPASNVGQVFGQAIGDAITGIEEVDGLDAIEIDPQQAADAYREKIVGPVRGLLPEAEIASITEQLSGSCTTEVASFNEFTALLADDSRIAGYDHVLFDTAPTGHTVRLLQLPGEWTTFLDAGQGDASCLGPMAGLDRARGLYAEAVRRLADPGATRLVLVARASRSTLAETARSAAELGDIGITGRHLVVNAVLPAEAVGDDPLARAVAHREAQALAQMPPELAALPRTVVPLRAATVMGLDAVRRLLCSVDPVSGSFGETRSGADAEAGADGLGAWAAGADAAGADAADADGTGSDAVMEVADAGPPGLRALVDDLAAHDHGLVMCMGKGGVGKTTVAAALAVALADRGHTVHLTTTDPADHLDDVLGESSVGRLTVSRIDPHAATAAYRERVMTTKGRDLDEAGRARLAEDLLSPCTEEVAVFGEFSHLVNQARRQFVVMDTAPTGHTLLLMDATGSYHRDIARSMPQGAGFTTPLMRLRDPALTRVVIVTLPDATPVLEAEQLQADLQRADIHPWAWVVNASLFAAHPRSPLLVARAAAEAPHLLRVRQHCSRAAILPLLPSEPRGAQGLRDLVHHDAHQPA